MRLARQLILAVVLGILAVVLAHDYYAVRGDMRSFETRLADDVATLGYGLSITLAQVLRVSGPEATEALIARRNQGDRIQIRWVALDVPPGDKRFVATFSYSAMVAALTIVASALLVVPTAFWVRWRLPRWRSAIEFITLLPFVINSQ